MESNISNAYSFKYSIHGSAYYYMEELEIPGDGISFAGNTYRDGYLYIDCSARGTNAEGALTIADRWVTRLDVETGEILAMAERPYNTTHVQSIAADGYGNL